MDEGGNTAEEPARRRPRKQSARQASFASGTSKSLSESAEVARASILVAAAQAFMEGGFAATSIDDVARRLGATKGLVYHHYRSKNDLFFDVCRHGIEIDFAAVEPHAAARERGVTRLRRMCEAHVRAMTEQIEFRLVLLQGVSMQLGGSAASEDRAALDSIVKERDRYERLFHQTLEACVREGDLPQPADPALVIKALFAVLNSPVAWFGPRVGEPTVIVRDLAIFALRGAGAGQIIIEEEFPS